MWREYGSSVQQHTVVGELLIHSAVYSPQLQNERDVLVWLPPSYRSGTRHYPVLYMHDGQNLFDAVVSYSGEWQVDETLTALSSEGIEAIVVGLPNQGELRRKEYNPYPIRIGETQFDGWGDAYISFIADIVKPLIDTNFRTLPDSKTTGIAGSSMGGLISLHGFLTRQDIFGLCGAFSPVWWIGSGLLETIQKSTMGRGKIYLDVGGKEGEVIVSIAPHLAHELEAGHQVYVAGVRQVKMALLANGYQLNQTLVYVEDAEAFHNEPAWANRLPAALRFLLSG